MWAVQAIVVITTAGSEEEANRLAGELVGRRLATCINVIPIRKSIYRWQGKLCEDSEFLLLIKSVENRYSAIEAAIQELHSYELPEILCFSVSRGEAGFLAWLADSLGRGGAQRAAGRDADDA